MIRSKVRTPKVADVLPVKQPSREYIEDIAELSEIIKDIELACEKIGDETHPSVRRLRSLAADMSDQIRTDVERLRPHLVSTKPQTTKRGRVA